MRNKNKATAFAAQAPAFATSKATRQGDVTTAAHAEMGEAAHLAPLAVASTVATTEQRCAPALMEPDDYPPAAIDS